MFVLSFNASNRYTKLCFPTEGVDYFFMKSLKNCMRQKKGETNTMADVCKSRHNDIASVKIDTSSQLSCVEVFCVVGLLDAKIA